MHECLSFRGIFEISQTFDVLQRIRKGEQVVAIVAPSILGQFSTTIEQVYGAFRQIGFTDIIEVAQGAMSTVEHEAHELIEKLEEGQKFMNYLMLPVLYRAGEQIHPRYEKIRFRHRLAYVLCRTYSQREVS